MKQLLLILFTLSSYSILAQEQSDSLSIGWSNNKTIKEFGMNVTGLMNQLIPFKQVTNKTGPYDATLKFINGRDAIRFGLGAHIISDDDFTNEPGITNFNMRIGYERRHIVKEKITFYQTFDILFMGGNFNSPINDFTSNDNAGFGVGLGLGIEYYLLENLSISTEGIGFFGAVAGSGIGLGMTVLPPIFIFLNYKF